MDALDGNRNQLLASIDVAASYASSLAQSKARNQASLFDDAPEEVRIDPVMPELPDWDMSEKLTREKDVLGFYVSGHPLDPYRAEIQAFSTISLANMDSLRDGAAASVCGMITTVKIHYDRRNRAMAFFTLENFTGSIELLAFSDPYSQYRDLIEADRIVVAQGRISVREEEKAKVLIDKVFALSDAWQSMAKAFYLSFDAEKLSEMQIERVNQIIRTNPGQCQLYFQIKENGHKKAYRSKKYRVRPNQDMLSRLQDLLGKENVWFDANVQ